MDSGLIDSLKKQIDQLQKKVEGTTDEAAREAINKNIASKVEALQFAEMGKKKSTLNFTEAASRIKARDVVTAAAQTGLKVAETVDASNTIANTRQDAAINSLVDDLNELTSKHGITSEKGDALKNLLDTLLLNFQDLLKNFEGHKSDHPAQGETAVGGRKRTYRQKMRSRRKKSKRKKSKRKKK